jgi:hypothetical protein
MDRNIPVFGSRLRNNIVTVPEVISQCSGIRVFGQSIKSFLFCTDVAIIRNTNANAIIAVYPFTPQPVISNALILAADKPIFCGVGGGITTGQVFRVGHSYRIPRSFGGGFNKPPQIALLAC